MERDNIIKALECCVKVGGYRDAQICNDCPLSETRCAILLPENALALINSQEQRIKELTEENERLNKEVDRLSQVVLYHDGVTEMQVEEAKADTVRKMHELIKEKCIKGGIYPAFVATTIDKIAKEMIDNVGT